MSGRLAILAYGVILALAICCVGSIATWTASHISTFIDHVERSSGHEYVSPHSVDMGGTT